MKTLQIILSLSGIVSVVCSQSLETIQWKGESIQAASGEALVLIKPGISKTTLINSLQSKGYPLKKDMGTMGVFLFGVSGNLVNGINSIRTDPNVQYAGPNTTITIDATPNDQYYQSQQSSNYVSISAPSAWDITSGDFQFARTGRTTASSRSHGCRIP